MRLASPGMILAAASVIGAAGLAVAYVAATKVAPAIERHNHDLECDAFQTTPESVAVINDAWKAAGSDAVETTFVIPGTKTKCPIERKL
jgi:phosphopantothenate synthetase